MSFKLDDACSQANEVLLILGYSRPYCSVEKTVFLNCGLQVMIILQSKFLHMKLNRFATLRLEFT